MTCFRATLWMIPVLALAGPVGHAQELPRDAAKLIEVFEKTERRILDQAEAQIEPHRARLIQELKALQDQHCRAARLDEAVAIRDKIRQVRGIKPDPGNLHVTEQEIGRSYLFETTGSLEGSIWGTEMYTSDSHLGTAAVHMGLLKPGQAGVIKVRIKPGQKSYKSTTLNGVTSQSYGPWPVSFTIEPYRLEIAR